MVLSWDHFSPSPPPNWATPNGILVEGTGLRLVSNSNARRRGPCAVFLRFVRMLIDIYSGRRTMMTMMAHSQSTRYPVADL